MSAHDQMRAMLDQLMGTARNGETNRYSVKFYDSKVCKSFLLGCCPHEILASTTSVTTRRFFLTISSNKNHSQYKKRKIHTIAHTRQNE
uniref:Uncharacterized protein n=2 Tax=gambiae species complex TaxID=44542 RepID=A0A1S4GYL5_ANOGA